MKTENRVYRIVHLSIGQTEVTIHYMTRTSTRRLSFDLYFSTEDVQHGYINTAI
jgi:hypothetical protein